MVDISEKQIRISLPKSARSIELIQISLERKNDLEAPITEEERHDMRSILGILQWLSGQTRVDIAVAVNKCAQKISKAVVEDLLECNTIGKKSVGNPRPRADDKQRCFRFFRLRCLTIWPRHLCTSETVNRHGGEITWFATHNIWV